MINKIIYNKKEIIVSHGLNVLVGPNGSGKSSFLKKIAYETACENKDVSSTRFKDPIIKREFKTNCHTFPEFIKDFNLNIEWDLTKVSYLNGLAQMGVQELFEPREFLMKETSFEDAKKFLKMSSGEQILTRLKNFLKQNVNIVGVCEDSSSSFFVEYYYKKEIEKYPVKNRVGTLLLDEPDCFLDMKSSMLFWKMLIEKAKGTQVFVASHSTLPLMIKDLK